MHSKNVLFKKSTPYAITTALSIRDFDGDAVDNDIKNLRLSFYEIFKLSFFSSYLY